MSTYRLVDDGYPFRFIVHKRKRVGRVFRHAEGHFIGVMHGCGGAQGRGDTMEQAFEDTVARHLGHASAPALKARNRAVRRANFEARRRARARVQPFADAIQRGDVRGSMDALDKIFDELEK